MVTALVFNDPEWERSVCEECWIDRGEYSNFPDPTSHTPKSFLEA